MHVSNFSNEDIPQQRISLRKKGAVKFLKGPIPLAWLAATTQLKGRCLDVGIVLWHLHGMSKTGDLKLTPNLLQLFGLNRSVVSRAFKRMEHHGLITVNRAVGTKNIIRIIVHTETSMN